MSRKWGSAPACAVPHRMNGHEVAVDREVERVSRSREPHLAHRLVFDLGPHLRRRPHQVLAPADTALGACVSFSRPTPYLFSRRVRRSASTASASLSSTNRSEARRRPPRPKTRVTPEAQSPPADARVGDVRGTLLDQLPNAEQLTTATSSRTSGTQSITFCTRIGATAPGPS